MTARSKLMTGLCWGGVALGMTALVGYGYASESDRRAHAVNPSDGCLAYTKPPAIVGLLNDRTDPITGEQPRRWQAATDTEIALLKPGSVLLIGVIGDAAPTEMKLERLCVPLAGRGAGPELLRRRFDERLQKIAEQLQNSPPSRTSDISGAILALAVDPDFVDSKDGPEVARRIVVSSDLLQNNAAASAYSRKGLVLPDPLGKPLKDVTVRFNMLRSERDNRLQTPDLVRIWSNWAGLAGGARSVEVDARWLGFVPPLVPVAAGAGQ